jgi:pimeloyl-ACP methyl ester carboxylesterase
MDVENVQDAVVVTNEDQIGGQRLVAYLVCTTQPAPTVTELRRTLAETLPDYMIPSAFVVLDALPVTLAGKVDRQSLPEPDSARPALGCPYVAPQDELELRLTRIWEQVLGIRSIGVKDNFFDLGGQSLLALHLFDQIKRVLQRDLPLVTLIQAPTVEELANILRQKDWKPGWGSLVEIQRGGSKPPLFLVHGAGGNILLYRALADHLGPDQPVYGLQSQGLDGEQPSHTRIEDMAARYLEELQTVQPKGPYLLGGYCLGGTVALDMAQQFHAQGQDVALLALFETHNLSRMPSRSLLDRVYFFSQRIGFLWDNLLLLDSRERMRFLMDKMKIANRGNKLWYGLVLSGFGQKLGLGNRQHQNLRKLRKLNDTAAFKYVPRVYPGRITQFRPVKGYRHRGNPELGWDDLAEGGVEIHELPVYPAAMLVEPFVAILADKLTECMDRALKNNSKPTTVNLQSLSR